MRIYIACGLTHVPRETFAQYVSFIHGLAQHLTGKGATVEYALKDSDPQLASKPRQERARLCYQWDRTMVEAADVLVAECSYPSTGLGIELQIAGQKDTPIVICYGSTLRNKALPVEYDNPDTSHHELQIGEGYVTLMALGIPSVLAVIPYTSPREAFKRIEESIGILAPNSNMAT